MALAVIAAELFKHIRKKMADKIDDSENGEDQKPAGGSKKLLIIGLILGLVVGGGGAAGALIMMGGDDDGTDSVKAVEVAPEPEKHKVDLHFVKIERFNVPLVYKGRILHYLMMDLSIEVDGNDNKLKVVHRMPAIRDAFLKSVTDKSLSDEKNPRIMDYSAFKKRFKDIANKVLHEELVLEVLIVNSSQF
jgi:flagellar FliL protein